jgi:hypothetical protein
MLLGLASRIRSQLCHLDVVHHSTDDPEPVSCLDLVIISMRAFYYEKPSFESLSISNYVFLYLEKNIGGLRTNICEKEKKLGFTGKV